MIRIFYSLTVLLLWIFYATKVEARDLVAGVSLIPPHAMEAEDGRLVGGFVEVVRAIDEVYTDGTISIQILPIKRSIVTLLNRDVDFQLPYIPNPQVRQDELSVIFVSEPIVDVAFVLYSRADGQLLPLDDLSRFQIETLRGAEDHFPLPISGTDSFRQGILRVSKGRSDGFIAEQDASDLFIRRNKVKNIRRTLYAQWKSSITLRKEPESEELNQILSKALRRLKQSGKLQTITTSIHRPFEDWQPYLMDWPQTQ